MVFHPICRRKADPGAVQKLWAGITYVRSQKQVANLDRLIRYIQRDCDMKESEVAEQLQLAIDDGLIVAYSAVASKGSNVGQEQDGFRISPEEEGKTRGTHDWYCYDCHKPGDVLECSECWRVYHVSCADIDTAEDTNDIFVCAVCKDIKQQNRMKRKELNRLLSFTIARLKTKSRELHWFGGRDLGLDRFVYHYMDLNTIEEKTAKRRYKYLEQFYSDARAILHNVFICHGDSGPIPEVTRLMIRDCRYDLDEIRQCKDCYYHSNARTPEWFCQPCRPPHELVFAKQKGFSYWPAKVIKTSPEGHDVRFFGALHQRAVIPATCVKPIDTPAKALALKRTNGFVKAMKELDIHREMLLHATTAGNETDSTGDNDQDDDQEEEEEERVGGHHGPEQENGDEVEEEGPPQKKLSLSDKKPKGPPSAENKTPIGSKHKKQHKKHRRSSLDGDLTPPPLSSNKKHKRNSTADDLSPPPMSAKSGSTRGRSGLEDSYVVSSSEDRIHGGNRAFVTMDIGIQTSKKLALGGRQHHKSTQTDCESGVGMKDDKKKGVWLELETMKGAEKKSGAGKSGTTCDCEAKYIKLFEETQARLDKEGLEERVKASEELAERLRCEFDEDRQKAVSRAVANVQREAERLRRQTEDRCKDEADEEIKKLTAKYKADISAAKKKQWCYNCEEEAMYHCCWNTSYCSIKCQQEHWHTEHKRMCRRKRN